MKMLSGPSAHRGNGATEYLVTFDLSADDVNQDTVIAALLRSVLDMGIAPRKLAEGRSLETQFLEVTGGQTDRPSISRPDA